jgi:hypothetical protein
MPPIFWRLKAAFVVLAALAAIPATARARVAFVQPGPIQLERKQDARTTVEVFNGSPRRRILRLRVRAAGDGRVSVRARTARTWGRSRTAPAGGVRTRPGRTATFELVEEETPGAPVRAMVVATSSDGTIAGDAANRHAAVRTDAARDVPGQGRRRHYEPGAAHRPPVRRDGRGKVVGSAGTDRADAARRRLRQARRHALQRQSSHRRRHARQAAQGARGRPSSRDGHL